MFFHWYHIQKTYRSSFQNYCSPSCKPQSSQHEPFFPPTTINITLRQVLQSGNHTCKPVLNPFQRNNETHLFLTNKPTKRSRRCHTCECIASWTVTGYQPVLGLTDFPTSSVFGLDVRFCTCSDWNYISNHQSPTCRHYLQYFARQFYFTTHEVLNSTAGYEKNEQVQQANLLKHQTLVFHFSVYHHNSFKRSIYQHTLVRPYERIDCCDLCVGRFIHRKLIIECCSVWIACLQCFDAVGWAAGRASGL